MKITTAAILFLAILPIPALAQEDTLVRDRGNGNFDVIGPGDVHTQYRKLGNSYRVTQDGQDGAYLILPLGKNAVITSDDAHWPLSYVPPKQ